MCIGRGKINYCCHAVTNLSKLTNWDLGVKDDNYEPLF